MLRAFGVRKPLSMGSFLVERIFWSTPNGVWWHILSGCQVCDWGIQYHLCSTLWGMEVVWLPQLSAGGSSQRCPGFKSQWLAGLFTFLYFCLITSKFLYFQHEARCSKHFYFWSIIISSLCISRLQCFHENWHTPFKPSLKVRIVIFS